MNIVLENKKAKNWILFLVLTIIYSLITIYIDKFLVDEDIYQQSLPHNLTQEQIEEIMGFKHKYSWTTYLFGVIFIFIKCALIAFVIYTGLILSACDIGISKSIKIVFLAEFIFLIPLFIKIVWFTFIENVGYNSKCFLHNTPRKRCFRSDSKVYFPKQQRKKTFKSGNYQGSIPV